MSMAASPTDPDSSLRAARASRRGEDQGRTHGLEHVSFQLGLWHDPAMRLQTREFPFPIPNGWFMVAYSDEIAAGKVLGLRYFGEDLVAYRGADGAVRVMDAYCPHLGANLSRGGKVEGDTIRCPFHGWRFAGDGACVEIPYAQRIPPRAQLRVWPSLERNGALWVWSHT